MVKILLSTLLTLTCVAASARGQGVQTGTLRGTVTDQTDAALAGVTVSVTSDALQGERTTRSDNQGQYAFVALPAGTYTVRFAAAGFAVVERRLIVPLGLPVVQDVMMPAAGVEESVDVVASQPAPIASAAAGANFQYVEVQALANQRHLQGVAQLAPAVTENTPNARQLSVNGAFAFDNVFMVNGVDVNDNLLAQPNFLFIEDAIQETQVLTSGISAEYGRFTGGVINAVTRSGGNHFSGSLRMNLLNPAWTAETPFEQTERLDDLQQIYEATLGGPIVTERLWFFAAGRYQKTESSATLPVTAITVTQPSTNHRQEVKVTGTPAPGHTVQAGYLNNSTDIANGSGVSLSLLVDPASLDQVKRPNWYSFANYRAVLRGWLLAEAQYSERRFAFELGGTGTDLADSLFVSTSQGGTQFYNAPLGKRSETEYRNNRQMTGSVTGFWNRSGRHETKAGYEFFRSQRRGIGSGALSPTDHMFITPYATAANGRPLLDDDGRMMPVFVPGGTVRQFFAPIAANPVMNTDTSSIYVQDHWGINSRWSADLGARFEHVSAKSTGGVVGAKAQRIVPRLAAAYDVLADGRHVVRASYGQYSGRYNENQFGANGPVGRSATITSVYLGPAGEGRSFAPGFDLGNYMIVQASNPSSTVRMDDDLRSPLLHELSVSYGTAFAANRGYADVSYVYRKATGLIDDFQTTETGVGRVSAGGVDAGLATISQYRNTDLAWREYQGMVFQSRWRVSDGWWVSGHYTLQLQNDGNYEGEAVNVPGQTTLIGSYPEAFNADRHYPDGRLQGFQRHRLRVWSIYDLSLGGYGNLSMSGLWRVDSGRIYTLVAAGQPLTSIQRTTLSSAGYPDRPSSQNIYFGRRGAEQFKGYGVIDAAVTYDVPVFRSVRPWVKFEVYNILNNQKLISWNTTIAPDPNSPKDDLDLPTGYVRHPSFGKASSTSNFPAPFGVDENGNPATGGRTFRAAVGFRF